MRKSQYSLEQILKAYREHGYNQTAAAIALGIARSTLQYHLNNSGAMLQSDSATVDPLPKSTDKDISQTLILRDRIRRLEDELRDIQRESLDAHFVRSKILRIKEHVDAMPPPSWLQPPPRRQTLSQSVPTLMLSDLHWGEMVDKGQMGGVNEYNLAVARKRLDTVVSKAISLLRNSITGEQYPGFVLALGGDMLSGDIHEELRETNEGTVITALLDLLSALVAQIALLADEFGKVYVPCVAGNHGRTTVKPRTKARAETNLDWLLYQFLVLQFQDDARVVIDAPVTPELTYRVFNHTYHLCHGDQLGKGGDGIIGAFGPIIRGDQKRRSLQAQLGSPYDTLLHGHYHTYAATRRFISNGSLVGYSGYALALGCSFEIPQQAFWLTHPEHGITFSMPVHAERPAGPRGAPKNWLSFEEAA